MELTAGVIRKALVDAPDGMPILLRVNGHRFIPEYVRTTLVGDALVLEVYDTERKKP